LRRVLGADHVGHYRARLEGKFVRQLETVDRRRDKIISVTAIKVEAQTLELGTQHAKAAMTPLAVPAADGKVNRHAVANLNSIRAWAKLDYFPSWFVTRDDKTGFGSLTSEDRFSVIDAHVAATQCRSPHLNEYLARARYRVRTIDNLYSFVPWK
jgi:hypothetical protein